MNKESEILSVKSLVAGYGDNIILQDVSFTLQQKEILIIIGQNGSGKSTLLKSICGLIPKKSGSVYLNNCELNDVTPNKLPKLGVSYFLQSGLIMPALTIQEHLELASIANNEILNSFEKAFTYFPKLYELKNKKAGNLSGGERQMLSFGILLIQHTKTWLLDEPTAGLAPSIVEFTIEFLERKNKEGISMLVIEHNMDVAFQLASNMIIAKNGTFTNKYNKAQFTSKNFLETIVYN